MTTGATAVLAAADVAATAAATADAASATVGAANALRPGTMHGAERVLGREGDALGFGV